MRVKSLAVALSITLVITLACTVSHTRAAQVRVAWQAPTHTDGTPVQDLAGYTLYYWQADWDFPESIDVGNHTAYILEGLEAGKTYSFAVTTYDTAGNESGFSNLEDYTIPVDNRSTSE
jgi:hypothetical protein